MRLAFHAPLKPPSHPVPSGDRRMARLILAALARAGHQAEVVSTLRTFDRTGDARRQARLRTIGAARAESLIRRLRARPPGERPRAFVTYHLFHKAPDWIGPAVAAALSIPYVVIEASHAPKQAGGRWDRGFRAAKAAIRAADAVLSPNAADRECLEPLVGGDRLIGFPPFIDTRPFRAGAGQRASMRRHIAARYRVDPGIPWLVAVGMMREGDKLESFRQLAAAMRRLHGRQFVLLMAGDGPARPEVEAAFRESRRRTCFLGRLGEAEMAALLGASDLFVWPAHREAYGMALLEAAAAGLPVVAGREGGVPGIVTHGLTGLLTPPGDVSAFARSVDRLVGNAPRRRRMGEAAARRARAMHGLDSAAGRLDTVLRRLDARRHPDAGDTP